MLTLDGVVAADSIVVGSSTLGLSDAESSYEGKYQFSIKLLFYMTQLIGQIEGNIFCIARAYSDAEVIY